MRILDIDLDFFLDNKSHSTVTEVDRLDDYYTPWSNAEVVAFLENNCGLRQSSKIRGKYFTHHVEVFHFLRSLQEQNNFNLTFSIDHIDAHADLGMGDASFKYIFTDILFRPLRERAYPEIINGWSGLSSGNFLAFAIACRWISDLKYVNHPNWFNDLPFFLFQNFDISSAYIQMKKFTVPQIDSIINGLGEMIERARQTEPLSLEPLVPFSKMEYNTFHNSSSYDYILLTQSPGFTPSASDSLLPVIQSYMVIE
ncbi:MAG: UPF0489 family protein [Chitinophagaceae bacterium]|nr:UPF0489 family protein [Chitinophagaceae bacterium]